MLVNGQEAGRHEGGYLPFCLDVTALLNDGENRLTAVVTDDAAGGVYGMGKQRYQRGGIWYTATSGIWQTVWLESVPENYVKSLRLTPDLDAGALRWHIEADGAEGACVTVRAGPMKTAMACPSFRRRTCGPGRRRTRFCTTWTSRWERTVSPAISACGNSPSWSIRGGRCWP